MQTVPFIDPDVDRWGAKIFNSPLGWLFLSYKYIGVVMPTDKWMWSKEFIQLMEAGTKKADFPPFFQIMGDLCLESVGLRQKLGSELDGPPDKKSAAIDNAMRPKIREAMFKMDALRDEMDYDKWARYMDAFVVPIEEYTEYEDS